MIPFRQCIEVLVLAMPNLCFELLGLQLKAPSLLSRSGFAHAGGWGRGVGRCPKNASCNASFLKLLQSDLRMSGCSSGLMFSVMQSIM